MEPKCHFWDPPQEILDEIFGLAYGQPSPHKIMQKTTWDAQEETQRKRQGIEYTKEPFATYKIDCFLVCKEFFINAAAAWMRAQNWSKAHTFNNLAFSSGLYRQFGTKVSMRLGRLGDTDCLQSFENLKELDLTVEARLFDTLSAEKYPWLAKLEKEDFNQIKNIDKLKELRGLKKFAIVPSSCEYATTESRKQLWKTNVAALSAYLTTYVQMRRGSASSSIKAPGYNPLYIGSRVSFSSSKLLPIDYWMKVGIPADFVIAPHYTMTEADKAARPKRPPQTAIELLQRTKMSPEDLWTWIVDAQKMLLNAQRLQKRVKQWQAEGKCPK